MSNEPTVAEAPPPVPAPFPPPPGESNVPAPFNGGRVAKFDDPANPGVILLIDVDHLQVTGAQAPSVHGLSFYSPVSGLVMKLDVEHWNEQAPVGEQEPPQDPRFTPGEIVDDTGAVVGAPGTETGLPVEPATTNAETGQVVDPSSSAITGPEGAPVVEGTSAPTVAGSPADEVPAAPVEPAPEPPPAE